MHCCSKILNFNTVTIYGFILQPAGIMVNCVGMVSESFTLQKAIIYWNVLIGEKYISYIWTFIKGG